MWKYILTFIIIINTQAKESLISIELEDYGRHKNFLKKQKFVLGPRKTNSGPNYSFSNKQKNKNILYKPILSEINSLLNYKNDLSLNCRQGTTILIKNKNSSKRIDLCTSPFKTSDLNIKLRKWIRFLRRF